MNKRFYIVFTLLLFGFLLTPMTSFACESKTEKSCCKKEISEKKDKKDCCNTKDSSKKDKSCGGKCGHSNCTSASPVNFSLIPYFNIEFKNNNFDFTLNKSKFYHSETFISSGFTSVWLIPKIK